MPAPRGTLLQTLAAYAVLPDLARERVAAPAEQLGRLETFAAGAPQRRDDQRALERGQRVHEERGRSGNGELDRKSTRLNSSH